MRIVQTLLLVFALISAWTVVGSAADAGRHLPISRSATAVATTAPSRAISPKTDLWVTPEQAVAWADQLDDRRFSVREDATRHLLHAGLPAVSAVGNAARQGELEVVVRSLRVLQGLALSNDEEVESAACEMLASLATNPQSPMSHRAVAAQEQLIWLRRRRSLDAISQLGARVYVSGWQVDRQLSPNVLTLEINKAYHGGEAGLKRHLKWLTGIKQVSLVGPCVTDDWLTYVRDMKDVTYVTVQQANITDAGVAQLRDLTQIRRLSFLYCPISDGSIESLKTLQGVLELQLYGTEITPHGVAQLEKVLVAKIDCRHGAFLGVRCDPVKGGCGVTYVQPVSAASKAGLRVGDVIVQYDGEAVPDFDRLIELIARNRPGEKVAVQVLRNEGKKSLEVVLGYWK